MPRLQNISSLYQVAQAAHEPYTINVMDEKYGAVADGKSHPLSDRFSTLEEAYAYYPKFASGIDTLDDQIDSCAIMEAYLDAMELEDQLYMYDIDTELGVGSYGNNLTIRPSLVIPRRYYRVTPNKIWFASAVDVYGKGAGFIGHGCSGLGTNHFLYPDAGQNDSAGFIIAIGDITHPNKPAYLDDAKYINRSHFELPIVFSDIGGSKVSDQRIDEYTRGAGIRIHGLYSSRIYIDAVYGLFRYGMVVEPIQRGTSYNEFYLGAFVGCSVGQKYCAVGVSGNNNSWITSNRMTGGSNQGMLPSFESEVGNSGIAIDFNNDPDQYFNDPFPSGYNQYWSVGQHVMEDFHVENRNQRYLMRLRDISGLLMSRCRGEAWNQPTFSGGYNPSSRGKGSEAVPRVPSILVDGGTYGALVNNIVFEDWHSYIPEIEYHGESRVDYQYNPIIIRSRNHKNHEASTDKVAWQGEELFYYNPGSGPILKSTDGNKAFRLQIEASGTSYNLKAQEIGMPWVSIRASGATDWVLLKEGLNHEVIDVPVSGYIEVKPEFELNTRSDWWIQWQRWYVGSDWNYHNSTGDSWVRRTDTDTFYMQVSGAGVYNLYPCYRTDGVLSNAVNPYDTTVTGLISPPYNYRNYVIAAFRVPGTEVE